MWDKQYEKLDYQDVAAVRSLQSPMIAVSFGRVWITAHQLQSGDEHVKAARYVIEQLTKGKRSLTKLGRVPYSEAELEALLGRKLPRVHDNGCDRPWPELSATECRCYSDGFSLLTPVGLHYYPPLYMAAEIVDSEEADVVVDALIGLFQGVWFYGPSEILSFWKLLTPSQLVVIGQWIDHYEKKYDFNDCTTFEVQNARTLVALFANGK